HAVLETVRIKNVRKALRHDAAEPVIAQRPYRMLARGAAAEVPAAHQHLRAGMLGSVKREVDIVGVVFCKPFACEEVLAKTGRLERLAVLGREKHVGID